MIDQDFLKVKKENKNNPNKNIIIIAVLVLILLVGGFFVFKNKITQKSEVDLEEKIRKQTPILPSGISMTVPEKAGELPDGFVDIPLNGKKEIIRSLTLNYQNSGSEQKVIDFTSSKSVKENFTFYKDWARKNIWNITYEIYTDSESRIIIEKDKKSLSIVIQKDAKVSSKVNMSW